MFTGNLVVIVQKVATVPPHRKEKSPAGFKFPLNLPSQTTYIYILFKPIFKKMVKDSLMSQGGNFFLIHTKFRYRILSLSFEVIEKF